VEAIVAAGVGEQGVRPARRVEDRAARYGDQTRIGPFSSVERCNATRLNVIRAVPGGTVSDCVEQQTL
jgi:hypothetical protein